LGGQKKGQNIVYKRKALHSLFLEKRTERKKKGSRRREGGALQAFFVKKKPGKGRTRQGSSEREKQQLAKRKKKDLLQPKLEKFTRGTRLGGVWRRKGNFQNRERGRAEKYFGGKLRILYHGLQSNQ